MYLVLIGYNINIAVRKIDFVACEQLSNRPTCESVQSEHAFIVHFWECILAKLATYIITCTVARQAAAASRKKFVTENYFLISQPKHVVGTQKDRLYETVILSTNKTCLN